MKSIFYSFSLISLSFLMSLGHTAVYECVENGHTVYTNKASKNCKSATLKQIGSYSSSTNYYPKATTNKPNNSKKVMISQSNNKNVSVSQTLQKTRDLGRLQILQTELANERKALSTAEQQLAQSRLLSKNENAEKRLQNISKLESHILDRKENIKALQQEITRM